VQPRVLVSLACVVITLSMSGPARVASAQAAARGTIKGHIRLSGKEPGNPVIRMGKDPMCAAINRGKQVVQETVLASLDGSLANVFVRLQGTFPPTPVPTEPVTIDQRSCIYVPRVMGVRVGQTLQVRNDDEILHNVHSLSVKSNSFNVSEPKAGMVQQFKMKDEEVMLRIKCDVHSWMTTYVGVVSNPYFAVTNKAGLFEIANVPPGTYSILAWQERYGPVMKTVTVKAGAAATVDFTYTGTEKPPAS
jgi:hypothetical protein